MDQFEKWRKQFLDLVPLTEAERKVQQRMLRSLDDLSEYFALYEDLLSNSILTRAVAIERAEKL